ncbi:MAG: hypothetical protein D6798_01135 [Deltaproteobacteria bacterium]|nr:MAG: hypothetical protein D6798_01135 [Deltaproteobacteria bacterium]
MVLLALLAAAQLVAVQSTAMVEVDPEESVNAGQALALLAGHVIDLPRLQYVDFCGGCTVDAVIGAAVFSMLPPSWLAWKLVPLAWLLLFAAVACGRLLRLVGPPAAVAAGVLLLLPLETWLKLSLIGLGNHYECAVIVGVALLLLGPDPGVRRAGAIGLLLGLAVWVGYSAAFGLPAAWVFLAWRRRWNAALALGAGAGVGLTSLLWRAWYTRRYPIRTLYPPSWFRPDPGRVFDKLADLARPTELAGAFGASLDPTGLLWVAVVASIGGAVVLALRRRHPFALLLLLALASWLVAYSVVGFRLDELSPSDMVTALGLRYLAPVFATSLLLLATVAGLLWSDGRRASAVVLLAPAVVAGFLARCASLEDRVPLATLARLYPVDGPLWNDVFSERFTEQELARCRATEPRHVALRAWARGRLSASTGTPPGDDEDLVAWAGGLGMGVQRRQPPHDRATVPEDPAAEFAGPEAGLVARMDALGLPPAARQAGMRSFWSTQIRDHPPPPRAPGNPESRAGLRWAEGREAGLWVAWFQPRPEALEVAIEARRETGELDRAWLQGLGYSAGERWGPMDPPPVPAGLSGSELMSLWEGYAEGVAARWLPAAGR